MSKLLLSHVDNEIISYLEEKNYQLIYTEKVEKFLPFENNHADMQSLIIDNKAFVLSCCKRLQEDLSNDFDIISCGEEIDSKYPHNIALNCVILNDYLIGKTNNVDKEVIKYALIKGLKIIDVNQGYTKCSCVIVDNNSIITEDESIYTKLKDTNIDVLKIEKGFVKLDGVEYGFIGGASGKINNDTLFFTGDITKHPNYYEIKSFCESKNVKIEYIKNKDLIDIGSIIRL